MANPQPTDAHLRVAHSINEAVMQRDFTKLQRKVLDLILRLSWGCGKKDAYIPHQRDFSVVGVHETDIKAELDWLEASKIIGRDASFYWFNKNFDEWQVSRVKPFQPKKLGELLSLNLNSNRPKLNKMLSQNLTNSKVPTKQNVKSPTPKVAIPKERLKKVLKKDMLPNFIDKETWDDYLEARRKKRAVPTEQAKVLLIKKLEEFRDAGDDPNEILKRSTMNGWTGIFPLDKKGGHGGAHQQSSRQLTPRNDYTKPEDY